MKGRRIRLIRRRGGTNGRVRAALYELEENAELSSSEERRANTIRYLLSSGATERVNITYDRGYDRDGFGMEHSSDMITSETSEEEFNEILARAEENPCGIGALICVNGERCGVTVCPNGEISSWGRHYSEVLFPNEAARYNNSETVWHLEDFFNNLDNH